MAKEAFRLYVSLIIVKNYLLAKLQHKIKLHEQGMVEIAIKPLQYSLPNPSSLLLSTRSCKVLPLPRFLQKVVELTSYADQYA